MRLIGNDFPVGLLYLLDEIDHILRVMGLFADEGVETGPSGLGVAVSG